MIDKHDFTIEKIKISPVNIDAEDEVGIRETILKLAHGHKKGETEIEVFKEFSSTLEQAFGAQMSLFNFHSNDYKSWRLILPTDGSFDDSPSKISISFHIQRVEAPN